MSKYPCISTGNRIHSEPRRKHDGDVLTRQRRLLMRDRESLSHVTRVGFL